jgi:CheY-like chemotaxis protein
MSKRQGSHKAMRWDLFVCHASEDKIDLVEPLAKALKEAGYSVWYDSLVLTLGDKLVESIQEGLSDSHYGLIVLSPNFQKEWTERELSTFLQREPHQGKSILPIWHRLSHQEVLDKFPLLASRVAVNSEVGIDRIVDTVRKAIGPPQSQRSGLQRQFPLRIDREFSPEVNVQATQQSGVRNYSGAKSSETADQFNHHQMDRALAMTLLFIDDDRRLNDELGEYFSLVAGWEVLHAYGSEEALQMVEGKPVGLQLIVLDIMMPPAGVVDEIQSDFGHSTGILLLEKLRARAGKDLPIVVLSARQDLGWLLQEGLVEGYLQKTLTPDEIVEEILAVMRSKGKSLAHEISTQ